MAMCPFCKTHYTHERDNVQAIKDCARRDIVAHVAEKMEIRSNG